MGDFCLPTSSPLWSVERRPLMRVKDLIDCLNKCHSDAMVLTSDGLHITHVWEDLGHIWLGDEDPYYKFYIENVKEGV